MRALLMALSCVLLAPEPTLAWCVGGAPPARDGDTDGLNDVQEQFFGTDPADPDSDDDLVPDNLEDLDGDGRVNQDEPHIFSIEFYRAPFGTPRMELVLEGTHLFSPESQVRVATIEFSSTGRFRRARHAGNNRRSRVELRLSSALAEDLLGATLEGDIRIASALGSSNTLHPVPMPCESPEPHLMGAAIVELRTPSQPEPLRYVAVGGCNLLDTGSRPRVWTRIVVDGETFSLPGRALATTLLPTRVLVPARWRSVDDPALPRPPDLAVGNSIQIETESGLSNAVTVEPAIAQLRIPDSHLDEDHDGDRLNSRRELEAGTDPLVFDTDRDGLSDTRELRGSTDPLDPDTDGNGILDGNPELNYRTAAGRLATRPAN